jgi:uncharacterized protein (DUF885 family)
MTDKEKEIAKLDAQLKQIVEDLLNPAMDNQTTFLLNALGKIEKKIRLLNK